MLGLNQYTSNYDQHRKNPRLLESAVPEIIRWQSPVAKMRRTAPEDVEFGGKAIRKGRRSSCGSFPASDESAVKRAGEFLVDQKRSRHHAAFGFGTHRCLGQRIAEIRLRVVWEEILKRYPLIEVVGEPVRFNSNFVKGYTGLPMRIPT